MFLKRGKSRRERKREGVSFLSHVSVVRGETVLLPPLSHSPRKHIGNSEKLQSSKIPTRICNSPSSIRYSSSSFILCAHPSLFSNIYVLENSHWRESSPFTVINCRILGFSFDSQFYAFIVLFKRARIHVWACTCMNGHSNFDCLIVCKFLAVLDFLGFL